MISLHCLLTGHEWLKDMVTARTETLKPLVLVRRRCQHCERTESQYTIMTRDKPGTSRELRWVFSSAAELSFLTAAERDRVSRSVNEKPRTKH